MLVVCEEAHRYIPRDPGDGFGPTRKAISRIAKEGRKYGVSLCLVTQSPSELSETILSQCNTLFALRMSNDRDQEFVRRALPESAAGMMGALPALRTQEAVVVGEGVLGEHERDGGVDDVAQDDHVRRGGLARVAAPPRRARKQALDRAEDELHVHGLRTRPPTPHPTEERGEEKDDPDGAHEEQHQEHRVGGEERRPEQSELAVHDVEEDRRPPVDFHVREHREERNEEVPQHPTTIEKPP